MTFADEALEALQLSERAKRSGESPTIITRFELKIPLLFSSATKDPPRQKLIRKRNNKKRSPETSESINKLKTFKRKCRMCEKKSHLAERNKKTKSTLRQPKE